MIIALFCPRWSIDTSRSCCKIILLHVVRVKATVLEKANKSSRSEDVSSVQTMQRSPASNSRGLGPRVIPRWRVGRGLMLHQLGFSPPRRPQPRPQVAAGGRVSAVPAQHWVSAAAWSPACCGWSLPHLRPSRRLMARWLTSHALSSRIIKGWAEHCWVEVLQTRKEKKKRGREEERVWEEVTSAERLEVKPLNPCAIIVTHLEALITASSTNKRNLLMRRMKAQLPRFLFSPRRRSKQCYAFILARLASSGRACACTAQPDSAEKAEWLKINKSSERGLYLITIVVFLALHGNVC